MTSRYSPTGPGSVFPTGFQGPSHSDASTRDDCPAAGRKRTRGGGEHGLRDRGASAKESSRASLVFCFPDFCLSSGSPFPADPAAECAQEPGQHRIPGFFSARRNCREHRAAVRRCAGGRLWTNRRAFRIRQQFANLARLLRNLKRFEFQHLLAHVPGSHGAEAGNNSQKREPLGLSAGTFLSACRSAGCCARAAFA